MPRQARRTGRRQQRRGDLGAAWPASSRPRPASAPGPSSERSRTRSTSSSASASSRAGPACSAALMLALLIGTHLFYPQGAAARRATTSWSSPRSPSRPPCCAFRLETLGGGEGHLHLPRRRHGHGGVQDLGRLLDLSGGEPPAHRRRAAVHRLHVCGDRLLHRRAAGGCSISASRAIRRCGRWSLLALAIYVNFFAHHYVPDVRMLLFAADRAAVRPLLGLFQGLARASAHAAAGRLRAGRAVHLDRREHRHLHGRLDVSAPARRLVAGLARQARRLVPADDHQLRAGGAREPAAAHGDAGRRAAATRP